MFLVQRMEIGVIMKCYNSREYAERLVRNIQPSMAFNKSEDFDLWSRSARGKLIELLGLPLKKCENDAFAITFTEETDDYKRISFEFQSEEGYFVPCELLCPKEKSHPLPTVICLQGHSTGKHISLGHRIFDDDTESYVNRTSFAIQAVKNGYCAVAFDQRYMGTAGQDEKGSPQCIVNNAALPSLLMGRTAIGERVWDVQRVIDILEKHFCEIVDTEKIVCMGNSGGGTATFYSAAVDRRIYLAVSSCAVCTFDDSIVAMSHCSCNYVPQIRNYFDMGDIGCLIAPRKLLIVSGKDDPIFPIDGAKKSYETTKAAFSELGVEDCCQMIVGDGGHRFYPDDVWPMVKQMLGK